MNTSAELQQLYNKGKKRKVLAITSIFIALILTIVIAISLGAGSPRLSEAVQVIFSKLFPFLNLDSGSATTQTIIWEIRFPRVILAIIAGIGLAASGATMQGALRNPLVSSYILGISAAAGFGAALAIAFGVGFFTHFGNYLVVANAFIFSLLAMLMVYGIARLRGITSETVILAGVAVGFLFSALMSLIQYIGPQDEAIRAVVFWLMGGLYSASWESLVVVTPIVLICVVLMVKQSWDMNILSLGEEVARSLGVNSKRVLVICMVLGTLATAAIIAFTGVIGFICLISPHIARMMIGSDHRFLLPCCTLVGAVLLLASDTLARLIIIPSELPVGIVTSLLGVPFFIYLLLSRKRQSWQ